MKIELRVGIDGMYWSGGAIATVPELVRYTFEPLKTSDDPTLAYVAGEQIVGSDTVLTILKTREDAAKVLAEELTVLILKEMNKNDTHNGYHKSD